MKLVVFVPDVPYPANSGGRVDVYNSLKALKRQQCEIILVGCYLNSNDYDQFKTRASEVCDQYYFFERAKKWYNVLHPFIPYNLICRFPYGPHRKELSDFARTWFKGADAFIIYHLQAAPLWLPFRSEFTATPVLYRSHNIETLFHWDTFVNTPLFHPKKIFYFMESLRTVISERWFLKRVSNVMSISRNEMDWFRKRNQKADIDWLPAFYSRAINNNELSAIENNTLNELKKITDGKKVLLYAGNFGGGFNVEATNWFIKNVFPFVCQKEKNAFLLYGGYQADRYFPSQSSPSTHLFYNVSSIRPYQIVSEVNMVITFSKAGVKLKLVESLMFRKKTVSTDEGVTGSGLEEFVPHSTRPEIMAEMIIQALNGNTDYSTAWNKTEEYYDPDRNAQKLIKKINSLSRGTV